MFDQQQLKKIFRPGSRLTPSIWQLLILVQLILLLLTWFTTGNVLFPNPIEIVQAEARLILEQNLLEHLGKSLGLSLKAVGMTLLIALPLCYATVIPFFRPLGLLISKLRFTTPVGISFLFLIMFGGGQVLQLSILTFAMSVFFVTSMIAEIDNIPKTEYNHARTIFGNEWRVTWEVVVLGKFHNVLDLTRQNFAITWMMLTLVEGLVRSGGGIGVLLLDNNKLFRMDAVFAIQITIILTGIALDWAFGFIRKTLCPYANLTLEKS